MPTSVEEVKTIKIDDNEIELRPLKIKHLREFMKKFDELPKVSEDNDASLGVLMECCAIAMRQYNPEFKNTKIELIIDDLEEKLDIRDVYLIVEAASGVKLGESGNLQADQASLGMI